MPLTLLLVAGVVLVVAVSAYAPRVGVAAPIALVLAGVGIGFLPGTPDVQIEPEWILAGVLPPLLYSAALDMPATDVRRNLRSITGLAVVLVALTTAAAGAVVHLLLPDVGWGAALAVGAVISPTDAVAASAVGRRLGLPPRLLTVLEGEGLVNDATALTLLRSAIAAMGATVSIWEIGFDFGRAVLVSVLVGVVVGYANVHARRLLPDPLSSTAVSFVVPFVAFVPAEHLDGSGVLAVVVAGLVTGRLRFRYLGAAQRVTEATNWRTIAYLLEGGIFFAMGLGLQGIREDVAEHHLGVGIAVLTGLAVALTAMLVRLVFMTPLVWSLRRTGARAADRKPQVAGRIKEIDASPDSARHWGRKPQERRARFRERGARLMADLDFEHRQRIGWRGGVVLGWAGMRGAITVAAAQTLPVDTPLRAQLVLVAYVVAVVTLVVQGGTLPMVIRAARIPQQEEDRSRQERLRSDLVQASLETLEQVEAGGNEREREVAAVLRARIDHAADSDVRRDEASRRAWTTVRTRMLDAQRQRLDALRSLGVYDSHELEAAQRQIDAEQVRWQELQE